ncbi:MAG: FecR domain-containing protein [Gammaproteobacteria bacterium]|nr:FecR domain-containing protein [Gammaproteobacteria bacterium]
MDVINKQRRKLLVKALSSGLYIAGSTCIALPAWSMAKLPNLLPGKSIYDLEGKVIIDGKLATLNTLITTHSVIETGADSKIIFAVGKDAFILRDNSRLEMQGNELFIQALRLVTGKLLSVFGKRSAKQKLRMDTVVATIGIRGTGIYVESDADKTYVCTCYGTVEIASKTDSLSQEKIEAKHHDSPRYVLKDAPAGERIQLAEMFNHDDDELELIEALVGRVTPFPPGEY